jgi:hypothetical protein
MVFAIRRWEVDMEKQFKERNRVTRHTEERYEYDWVPERFDQSKEKTLISHHHHCREEQRP